MMKYLSREFELGMLVASDIAMEHAREARLIRAAMDAQNIALQIRKLVQDNQQARKDNS